MTNHSISIAGNLQLSNVSRFWRLGLFLIASQHRSSHMIIQSVYET